MPTLALLVNTYENPAALAKVFENILAGSRAPDEVVVADDGSGETTRHMVAAFANRAPFPVNHAWQEKQGFRRSRILNRAIARTTAEYIVFLDGDCIPSRHFLRDHEKMAEPGYFVQGRRCFIKEDAVPAFLGGARFYQLLLTGKVRGFLKSLRLPAPRIKVDQDEHGVLGCNLAIWRKDLVRVNGYEESFEGWGREDSELALRLYHTGVKRRVVWGRAIICHLNHPPLPRDHLNRNDRLLEETRDAKRTEARRGLREIKD